MPALFAFTRMFSMYSDANTIASDLTGSWKSSDELRFETQDEHLAIPQSGCLLMVGTTQDLTAGIDALRA